MTAICPFCLHRYIIGVNGIVDGCDVCTGTVRNPIDNTIVYMDFSNVFADDDEDTLTDMEKA